MIRKTIKRIPILGNLATALSKTITKGKRFESSEKYWKERYRHGGNSGDGSYNKLAEFKGDVINNFILERRIESITEFGSGDGNQLKYINCKYYLGYDISGDAIKMCQRIFSGDTSKEFRLMKNYVIESTDLSISLDVIYHLIEDRIFDDYMTKLFDTSHQYVLIYSSNTEENDLIKAPHVKNRLFTNWVEKNRPEFKMIELIPNKYPFDGNNESSSISDFFIFELSK